MMASAKSSYKFTSLDATSIAAMGYVFKGISLADFVLFMNKDFPRFNLASLLKTVETLMAQQTSKSIIREIIADVGRLEINFENEHLGVEDDALIFHRIFYKENKALKVNHKFLVFPLASRNQKLSKKILKASLTEYLNMGLSAINVVAGLSAGSYVWARAGFVAVDRAEMDSILNRSKKILATAQYTLVKKVYDNYYLETPKGKSFPIGDWAEMPFMRKVLMAGEWTGRLNLKNKLQLRKFDQYVSN